MLNRGRTALRNSSASRTSISRAPVSRLPSRQKALCTSTHPLRLVRPYTPVYVSQLPSYRPFSTTPLRRKDKPPESEDPAEQVLLDESKDVEKDKEKIKEKSTIVVSSPMPVINFDSENNILDGQVQGASEKGKTLGLFFTKETLFPIAIQSKLTPLLVRKLFDPTALQSALNVLST